jgi:acyl carrier protein
LCASAFHIQNALQLTPADRCLNVMPLFHIHGLAGALLSSLACGASVVCTPGFEVARFFEWLARFRPTWYTAVPTMHQALLREAARHLEALAAAPLRLIRSCSAALPPQVMAELERVFNAPVIESYGMTEASHQMTSNPLPPRKRKPGSVGIAAGPEVVILGPDWSALPAGTCGEVAIRGPNVTPGYENNPEANETAFAGGWFRTGDQGYVDEEGYLFLTGRLKEIINRGGEKLSPREIDEALLDHPAVAQALAFAIPHPTLGEDVGAAVVLREGRVASPVELRAFAARRLADFKVPRTVVLLEEIPKGPTGKPQRIGLAERLGLGVAQGNVASSPPRTETEKRLAQIWSSVLKCERVGVCEDFFAAGGDSLGVAVFLAEIEKAFGKRLPLAAFVKNPTIEGLVRSLAEHKGTASESSLVELQPRGERRPLFCVPAAAGTALLFSELARQLAPEQPVYGLQSVGLDGQQAPLTTVTQMAAHYVEAIKAARPEGPYSLLGYCLGAFIALEMAVQLQERGDAVAFLGIVSTDGAAPGPRSLRGHLQYHWPRLSGPYVAEHLRYRWQRVLQTGAGLLCPLWLACGRPLPQVLLRQRVQGINHRAGLAWQLRAFRGRITYFQGQDDPCAEPTSFWGQLASKGVELVTVPGWGEGIFGKRYAAGLAAALRKAIQTPTPPTRREPRK